jgi:hypothetical protein
VRRVEEHYSLKTMMFFLFFGQKIAKQSERETLFRPNAPCTTCPIRQSKQNRAMAIAFDHERQGRHDGSVLARETRDGAVVQWNIYF